TERRNDCQIVMRKPVTHILFCFLIAASISATAQEQFVDGPAKLLTSFRFKQLSGGVIMLNARFANFPDTLNFILDTGSGGISLDSTTVDYFRITPTPSDMTILGIAGIRKVSFIYNQKLRLPGLTVDSLNFHINNYEILTQVYGEKIDGIIGYSLLSRYIFNINYDSSRISIFSNGRMRYPRGGWLYEPILRTLPVQSARIKDAVTTNSRFLFDIGAGLCMMLNKDFIEDSNFLNKKRVLYAKEAEGVGGKVDMHMTVIKEMRMGPYRFKNIPVFVFDDTFNLTSYPYLSGIIGNDILRRFNLILNYAKREFYFMPNSHYQEGFDYAYSGIELYYVDGQIILGDVATASPAEVAGLREGDILVGINNLLGANIQQYKTALQASGEKVRVIVTRDGKLMEFSFKIKSILSK
ncbi:MAG TPA: aspartyl protease family protein, partial [Chitinophagaceae bacterium]|nr:aspartyl protease family protein [Chitinophagaceae bacterium]